jgi:hypothetical protein
MGFVQLFLMDGLLLDISAERHINNLHTMMICCLILFTCANFLETEPWLKFASQLP